MASPRPENTGPFQQAADAKSDAHPPDANPPDTGRDVLGRFGQGNPFGLATRWQPGNRQREDHGVRAHQLTGRLSDLDRDWRDDVIAGLLADKGGTSEVTTGERLLINSIGMVATDQKLYRRYLDGDGLMTSRGTRRAAADGFNAATDRLRGLLALLGLSRRARQVESLDHYITRVYGRPDSEAQEASRCEADRHVEGEDDRASQGSVTREDGIAGHDNGDAA